MPDLGETLHWITLSIARLCSSGMITPLHRCWEDAQHLGCCGEESKLHRQSWYRGQRPSAAAAPVQLPPCAQGQKECLPRWSHVPRKVSSHPATG